MYHVMKVWEHGGNAVFVLCLSTSADISDCHVSAKPWKILQYSLGGMKGGPKSYFEQGDKERV
jgi:hypothetical protein